jgi:HEPN domain-containing protein
MKPSTAEWVDKAEGDFTTAQRELRARKKPNYDAVCYHAQQSTEKYLKAWLQENGIIIPKTHDLVQLLSLCPENMGLHSLRDGFSKLSAYAVEFRYPGENADKISAKEAMKICCAAKAELRGLLKLDE